MKRTLHTSKLPISRWLGRGAFMASTGFLYLMVALAALAILVPLATGMRSTVIVSGSMGPSLAAGDVVLVADHQGEGLDAGTVVMFTDPARPGRLTTHRIVGVNQDGSYRTAGDANAQPDSTPVSPDQVVGMGRVAIPFIGLPALWLRAGGYGELAAFALLTLAAYTYTRWFARWSEVGSTPERSAEVPFTEDAASDLPEALRAATVSPKAKRLVNSKTLVPLLAGALVAITSGSAEASFQSVTSNTGNSLTAAATFDAINFIRTVGSSSCGGTSSVIVVPAGGVPVGDTLLVRVALRNSSAATPVTATDSAGNMYSVDADAFSGNRIRAVVLSAHVDFALGSLDSIVVSHANGRAESVVVEQFSGIAATGRVEAAGTGAANSTTPSAMLASGGGEVLLYGAVANRGNVTHTEAVGWTTLPLLPVNCTRRMHNAAGFQIVNTSGSFTYQTTLSAPRWWAESLVAYRAE